MWRASRRTGLSPPRFQSVLSLFEFDERGPYRGWALRGGAAMLSYFDVVLIGEHWPEMEGLVGWATQLEVIIYPAGRPVVAPRVMLGAGHFWALPESNSRRRGVNGFATSFGIGAQARIWRSATLAIEGLVRYDAGAGDVQVRLLAGYAPHSLARPLDRPPHVAGLIYGMAAVAGPWRFAEPGYGVRFTTPVTQQYSGSLGVALLHLRIPHPTIPRAYTWDTRAVLITPALQSTRGWRIGELRARAGPALSLMFEGPDYGVRGGVNLEFGGTLRAGPIPLTAGAGWLWLIRHQNPGSETTGADQHALLLSAGIGF